MTGLQGNALAAVLLSADLAVGSAGKPAPERPMPRTDLYGDPLPEGVIARMGSIRMRHVGLSDFVLMPGGKTIVTAGGAVLRFWDMATGKQVRQVELQGAASWVGTIALSPDGKTVAAHHWNHIAFWEIDSGKRIQLLDSPRDGISFLHFSPDSKILAVGTQACGVILWEWQNKKERRVPLPARKIGFDSTFHGCFSPDGKWFVGGGGWGAPLCVYELATLREVHRLDCYASTSTISPDGKRLAVASMSAEGNGQVTNLRFFDLANGKELARHLIAMESAESFFSLAFAPDGKTLACGGCDQSCLVDCAGGKPLRRLPGLPREMAFSPDGKLLFAQSGPRLRVWEAAGLRERHDRPGQFGNIPALAVSRDGKILAAADWGLDGVNLWEAASGTLLRTLPLTGEKRYVQNLAFSADGKTLLAGQAKGSLQLWDIAIGKEQGTVSLRDPSKGKFYQLHLSSDGKSVSTLERFGARGESTRLALWDVADGNLVSQHVLPPRDLPQYVALVSAWSADGSTLTLRRNDGLAQMRVDSGAIRFHLPDAWRAGALATSPDDRLLAAALWADGKNEAVVSVWEEATARKVATVATGRVFHLALTADNRHLVAVDRSFLRVRDLATGKERSWSLPDTSTRPGEDSVVTGLLLSPDGRRAFTALNDGTALVWELPSPPRPGRPRDKELADCWTDLLGDDAGRAYAAIWKLTEAPEAAVPFLRQHLQPATDAEVEAIRRLVTNLDSEDFALREKAFDQLAKLGALAEPVLRRSLAQMPSLEARRRMQLLLERSAERVPVGEQLRLLRALQVLEKTGTQGHRLLRALAGGAEDAWLTGAARSALRRTDTSRLSKTS